jgi:anti-anti-sigma factor
MYTMTQVTLKRRGPITLVTVSGRLDGTAADALYRELAQDYETRHAALLLDLSSVDYLSGAGLRALRRLNELTDNLRLASPSDRVREVLQISGLDTAFNHYDTPLAAARSVNAVTNAHTHLELTWAASLCPRMAGQPFLEWIQGLVRANMRVRESADYTTVFRHAAEAGIAALIEAGTTHVGDITASGLSIEPLLESGLAGVVYMEALAPWSKIADERFERARDVIERWRPKERNGMRIGLTLHAPYTVHPDLWRKALDYARAEQLPLCIHVAESPEEYQYLKAGTGAMAVHQANIASDIPVPYTTPVRYLEDLGALALKPLLAHAVQVDADDIRRIQASGSQVVHCPRSNLRLCCGRMPLEQFLAQSVPVYLGTDSLSSSPSLDVFEEAETAVALHHGQVTAETIERLLYRPL